MVEELVLLLQELLARHRALALENSQLLEQLRLLVCERATLQQQVCPPSCLLSSPSKGKGDGDLLPALIVQTLSYMLANQERFFNDALKVAFLISLLSGNSESWVASYLQKQSTLLSDYAVFVEEMKRQFGWYDDDKDEEEEEEE
ncbi:protein LDOC1, partial [Acomys russatus]|uniref:protein LDOC1 n=1 Tax=Acomys russatus TaxID=60746 RepID=UPI0021E21640